MMEFNANHIKTHSNYKNFRDKIYKDIIKKNIIVDSYLHWTDQNATHLTILPILEKNTRSL